MLVEAHGIFKTYASEDRRVEVLKGVDFEVAAGEMVAIVGSSGVGKSTLLHVLGTLDVPDEGTVRFDDQDVFALEEDTRTRLRNASIGFIFQFHHLLPEFTAVENVAMPLLIARRDERESKAHAAALLRELGLGERVEHRPSQLSGGEQQRVAVARALVAGPKLVLADEPTGNLDSRASDELVGLFRELHAARGLSSVIVTHSEAVASVCDRTVRMVDGRVAGVS